MLTYYLFEIKFSTFMTSKKVNTSDQSSQSLITKSLLESVGSDTINLCSLLPLLPPNMKLGSFHVESGLWR